MIEFRTFSQEDIDELQAEELEDVLCPFVKNMSKLGKYGDTMDDIINKCIQAYKKINKL